jgi:hypothetical protein
VVFAFDVDTSGAFTYFEAIIDTWFLMEIMLNFFTGFYYKGALIMNRKRIFISYLTTWFVIDLFSSIPLSLIELSTEGSDFKQIKSAKLLRVLRLAKYARLIRIIKFIKVNKIIQEIEIFIVNDYANLAIRFFKISIAVFFIAHWIACVLFAISANEFDTYGENWISL